MLVTFHTDAYENITMFAGIAQKLLKMMGHSGTIPGAILAKDIPDALECLKSRIKQEKQPQQSEAQNDDDNEPEISLSDRAFPLIKLLENAAQKNCKVMWDKR